MSTDGAGAGVGRRLALPGCVASLRVGFLWTGLAACTGGPPADLSDCADATCRQQWLVARHVDDPEGVAREVAGLTDPVEQEAVIIALSEARPGTTGPLCDALRAGPAKERCERINTRPHLQATASPPDASEEVAGTFLELTAGMSVADPWTDTTPEVPESCAQSVTPTCVSHAAQQLSQAGEIAQAAAACVAIDAGQWRAECFFGAAESSFYTGDPPVVRWDGLDGAIALCRGAGSYQVDCLRHLIQATAAQAPPADAADQSAWTPLLASLDTIHVGLVEENPDLATLALDRGLAEAADHAYAKAGSPAGNPFDHFPTAGAPHLRASLARQVLPRSPAGASLAELSARVATAEQRRGRGSRAAGELLILTDSPRTWTRLLPGEAALPWAHYRAEGRRRVDPDPQVDRRICVVEAALSTTPLRPELLEQAVSDPAASVRWTAYRILSHGITPLPQELPSSDPDPLAAARLHSLR